MRLQSIRLFGLVSIFLISAAVQSRAENWPQFRGTASDGISTSACPLSWTHTENVHWKIPLAGEGWSCPVVWGDQVFLTAAVPASANAQIASYRPESYQGGGGRRRSDLTKTTYRWEVICLDAETGRQHWRQIARIGRPSHPRHSSNSYATETPVTDGRRVYVYFGMTGLYCYDLKGELQWARDLGTYEMRAGWGTSSSPVLLDGKLFLQIDNQQQSFLVALDPKTGDELWHADRNEPSQYSSPILWQNSQRDELIVGGQLYRSYDPQTGRLLWQLDMAKGRSSATPLAVKDRLYVGTEFRNRGGSDDGGGYLFAVKPGGSGDITPRLDADFSEFVQWKLERSGIQMASPAICGGHIYLLERRSGILTCVDAEAGTVAYRQRVPGARAFWASPWVCGDRVYCLDADGTTHVIAGGPEFEVLAKNRLDEQTWSSPAVANGKLYLRTIENLYCIAQAE